MSKLVLAIFLVVLSFSLNIFSYAEENISVLPFEINSNSSNLVDKNILSNSFSEMLGECLCVNNKVTVIDSGSIERFMIKNRLNSYDDLIKKDKKGLLNTLVKGVYTESNNRHRAEIYLISSIEGKQTTKLEIEDTNLFTLNKSICNALNKKYKLQLNNNQKDFLEALYDKNNNYQSLFSFTEGKKAYNKLSYKELKKSAVFFSDSFGNNPDFTLAQAYRVEADTLISFLYFQEGEKVNYLLQANEINLLYIYSQKNLLPIYRTKSLIDYLKGDYSKGLNEAKKAFDISNNDLFANYLFNINRVYKNQKVTKNSFDNDIKKNPYSLLPLFSKGSILYSNKDKNTKDFFKNIISISPENTIAYNYLGKIYYDERNQKQASKMFSEGLSLDTENPISLFKVGELFNLSGDYKQAIKFFNDAITYLPESDNFRFSLGVAYHSDGLTNEAIKSYKEAIEINPKEHKYYAGLGQSYYKKEMYTEALNSFKKALEINKKSAYVHVSLALIYNQLNKNDDAIREIQEALKINNKYSYAYYNLGVIYKNLGNHNEAIKAFKSAIKNDYNYLLAYYKLGESYKEKGLIDDALKSFEKAVDIDSTYISAYNEIGKIKQNQKKYPEAINTYKEALKINSKYKPSIINLSNLYFERGIEFYSKNKVLGAIKYYEESIKLKPDNAMVYNNLGVAYFSINKYTDAIMQFKKASLADPTYIDAYDNLGIAYQKIGNKAEALKNYQKACELGKKESCELINSL